MDSVQISKRSARISALINVLSGIIAVLFLALLIIVLQ